MTGALSRSKRRQPDCYTCPITGEDDKTINKNLMRAWLIIWVIAVVVVLVVLHPLGR
jgi:hypothetical protein